MSEIKNAVIYARYSSDRQREESIEGQVRVCEDFAKRNGYRILRTYADRAMTGRTDQRPQFQLMVRDAESMDFSAVIVYKLNRFARDRYDSAKYKHKLKKFGVKVVSAMENIADDPSGILLESVIEGMAEYYSAELAENVKRGMTENALEGKWAGGSVPFGYRLDANHHLRIEEREAEAVRFIFKSYLSGMKKRDIADYLTEKGIRGRRGLPLSPSSFNAILTNEVYTGVFHWGSIRKPGLAPAILDEVTFKRAQLLKGSRKKFVVLSPNYPLSGKCFCGLCGARLDGKCGTAKNGSRYYYYTCHGHIHHQCGAKPVRVEKLDDLVLGRTADLLDSEEVIDRIARQAAAIQQRPENNSVVKALEADIKAEQKRLNNCLKAVENGLCSESVVNHIKELEEHIQELHGLIDREKLSHPTHQVTADEIAFYFDSMREQYKTAGKFREIIVSNLIRCVIVYGKSVEIQYNYKSELPLLEAPGKSSHSDLLVDHQGFEPRTP